MLFSYERRWWLKKVEKAFIKMNDKRGAALLYAFSFVTFIVCSWISWKIDPRWKLITFKVVWRIILLEDWNFEVMLKIKRAFFNFPVFLLVIFLFALVFLYCYCIVPSDGVVEFLGNSFLISNLNKNSKFTKGLIFSVNFQKQQHGTPATLSDITNSSQLSYKTNFLVRTVFEWVC